MNIEDCYVDTEFLWFLWETDRYIFVRSDVKPANMTKHLKGTLSNIPRTPTKLPLRVYSRHFYLAIPYYLRARWARTIVRKVSYRHIDTSIQPLTLTYMQ